VSMWGSVRAWAIQARQLPNPPGSTQNTSGGGWWSWINTGFTAIGHFFSGQFTDFVRGVEHSFDGMLQAFHALQHTVARVEISILHDVVVYLKQYTDKRIKWLHGLIESQLAILKAWTIARLLWVAGYARQLVQYERLHRIQADIKLDHEIKTRIKWLHQQIEREAVSAYRAQAGQQNAIITRVLDLVINLNPVLRPIVTDLITAILDLAAVDDPVARIAIGFALRQVIDRLGLDRPIGELLHGLLASIIGQGKPHDLHAVVADICSRLAAGEQQWAQFYADGGSEILQAGEQWQGITRWTTDAAFLALFGVMALEPAAFARDVTGALAVGVNDTIKAYHALIKGA
jgi:hypothetical protein